MERQQAVILGTSILNKPSSSEKASCPPIIDIIRRTMTDYGFVRVAACTPAVRVADVEYNTASIETMIREAADQKVSICVFPELCVTGYTCADLFRNTTLLKAAESAVIRLAEITSGLGITVAIGAPLIHGASLYNCAVILSDGKIAGVVPKTHLPNYNEFYERRWFCAAPDEGGEIAIGKNTYPFGKDLLFDCGNTTVGVEICEDLWVPEPPSTKACKQGAEIILNLSASDETIGKNRYLTDLIRQQSGRCRCGYIYASAGFGESSTDLVYAGKAMIAEDGCLLASTRLFSIEPQMAISEIDVERLDNDRRNQGTFCEGSGATYSHVKCHAAPSWTDDDTLTRHIESHPFVPSDTDVLAERCEEITSIQAFGLMQRLNAIGCSKAVIGISGGLDSTLALLITVKAFDNLGLDRKGITGITMPGFGTTGRTHDNAVTLMERLGVSIKEIDIRKSVEQHFKDIGHDPDIHDVTYENCQARERTQILMDYSNKVGGIVIGTGDLSELALGWCTYNGDQMSMYGVNASVPKTLVRYLVEYFAHTTDDKQLGMALRDVADTPISPELIPADDKGDIVQKTEDLVGPYELHDFFIYQTLRNAFTPRKTHYLAMRAFGGKYSSQTIKHWLSVFYRRFFGQQFKRSCMPDGPKVGSICLSPRGDWRMPSDASRRLWLDECDSI